MAKGYKRFMLLSAVHKHVWASEYPIILQNRLIVKMQ